MTALELEMYEALKCAEQLIPVARKYFPKSIRNSDRFRLENTCATIGKALFKADGVAKETETARIEA